MTIALPGSSSGAASDSVSLEADASRMHSFLGRILEVEAGAATAIGSAIHTVRKSGTAILIGVHGPPWNAYP